ncbi:MAG: hypothetical protein Q4C13_08910, partial [Clostridia bacterium]|nr:hypothetical protein [Clostridia bacterium]
MVRSRMRSFSDNLNALMTRFSLTDSRLARELSVEPALVEDWRRGLRVPAEDAGVFMRIAELALSAEPDIPKCNWLKKQFRISGMRCDTLSAENLCPLTARWLAGGESPDGPANPSPASKPPLLVTDFFMRAGASEYVLHAGLAGAADALSPLLERLPAGAELDLRLSAAGVPILASPPLLETLLRHAERLGLRLRALVALDDDAAFLPRFIETFLPLLAAGDMRLYLLRELGRPTSNLLSILSRGQGALLIADAPGTKAGLRVMEISAPAALDGLENTFARALRCAQPAFDAPAAGPDALDPICARPDDLDIDGDCPHPFFMSRDAFESMLLANGYGGGLLAGALAAFERRKAGLHACLDGGAALRERFPLQLIRTAVSEGSLRLPAPFSASGGCLRADAEACASMLEGYLRCLRDYPAFHLLMHADASAPASRELYIKRGEGVALRFGNRSDSPVLRSRLPVLERAFRMLFNGLWTRRQ